MFLGFWKLYEVLIWQRNLNASKYTKEKTSYHKMTGDVLTFALLFKVVQARRMTGCLLLRLLLSCRHLELLHWEVQIKWFRGWCMSDRGCSYEKSPGLWAEQKCLQSPFQAREKSREQCREGVYYGWRVNIRLSQDFKVGNQTWKSFCDGWRKCCHCHQAALS